MYKISKSFFLFISLFFLMNIEISLSFFSIFHTASPSLISIVIFLCIKKLNIKPSNLILFFLGILNDVIFGSNLGTNSMQLLLIKIFTERLSFEDGNKENDEDWIYFTIIFIISFSIIFLINTVANVSIPDLSPILFHIGVTLIIFPIVNLSLDFIYFITNILKN